MSKQAKMGGENDQAKVFSFIGREFDAHTGEALFTYRISDLGSIAGSGSGTVTFAEKIVFPKPAGGFKNADGAEFSLALDAAALALGVSYWKIYCPKEIRVEFTALTREQADFWNILYTKGLGQFFYENKIDFRGLLNFPFGARSGQENHAQKSANSKKTTLAGRSLLMVGGGKDSIVSAEMLKKQGKPFTQFVLNSDPIKDAVMAVTGGDKIVVARRLDPQLFALTAQAGTYNGHVPITALVQSIALCAALLYDFSEIIASNEESASHGNVEYLGQEINHQWSKSLEFEKLWQGYIDLFSSIKAFSLLRAFSELAIMERFSALRQYFSAFSSCNGNFKINKKERGSEIKINRLPAKGRWCGECPKCAFVFIGLAAFLPKKGLTAIFDADLLNDTNLAEKLLPTYRELLGLEKIKPFECVGTPEEVKLAFYLAHKRGEFSDSQAMKMFVAECGDEFEKIEKNKAKLLAI